MWSFARYALLFLLAILLPPALYLAAAVVGALLPAAPATGRAPGDGERIYLLTTLLHADIAIPIDEEVRQRYAFLETDGLPIDHPSVRYLIFGWGSRAFYAATRELSDMRPGPVYEAVTGDEAVMHVYVAGDISGLPNARPVRLPPGGMQRMLGYIDAGFDTGAGRPQHLDGLQYGPTDGFYAGTGRFDILRPCNIWVTDALRAAGVKTGRWTPTTQTLLLGLAYHSPGAMRR